MQALLIPFFVLSILGLPPAAAPTDERPTVLVWSRDVPQTLRETHRLAWSWLAPDYDLRFLEAFDQQLPGPCQPKTLTHDDLAGVDLLVLADWDGTFGCGMVGDTSRLKDADANLTPGELDMLEQFVASGGGLLAIAMPVGRSDKDNLPDLLARFGLMYAHTRVGDPLETPHEAIGRLETQSYTLKLNRTLYAVEGGTPLIDYQGRSIAAVTHFRQGRVAFLGAPWTISDDPEHGAFDPEHLNYPPGILSAEHAPFFAHLVAYLTDRPPLPAALETARLWRLRLDALTFAFSGGVLINNQPAPRGVADPARVRTLREAYHRGTRCDISSACVPFPFEPDDLQRLDAAQQQEERAWEALERMRRLLAQPAPDLAAVAAAHDEAVQSMTAAYALTAPILARPVSAASGGARLYGAALLLTIGGGIGLYQGWRRKRQRAVA
jgi:hypothetical protein